MRARTHTHTLTHTLYTHAHKDTKQIKPHLICVFARPVEAVGLAAFGDLKVSISALSIEA